MNLFYPSDKNSKSKAVWVLDAFHSSCDNATKLHEAKFTADTAVFWSLGNNYRDLIKQYQENKHSWIFTDMPYWNRWMGKNRDSCYWRVIPNALHCNWLGDFPNDRSKDIAVKDWKNSGDYILVCPSSASMENFFDLYNWLENTQNEIRKYTDRPIKVRIKPRANGTSGPRAAKIPFEEDCQNAWAVVTSMSIAGVEAVVNGTPVFCHPASVCAPVGNLSLANIESPVKPDIAKWLNTISYYQYTEKEIASGQYREIL